MPIDYCLIRQENIKKYGTDIGQYGPVLLENLYSDQTHFIFELLQNAEDAEATQVQFRLYPDRLELEHDGRPFNEADVRGICGLVIGTKRDDINKIGKFGIGFKSVYAHTSSPEIHSEDEHFAIDNYVQPRSTGARSITTRTLFVFPFNHANKSGEESHHVIAEGLQDLGARTLLFLRNIDEVSYRIEDGNSETYLRQRADFLELDFIKQVAVIDERSGEQTEEKWLVFERNIAHPVGDNHQFADNSSLTVQIAFLVSEYEQNGRPNIIKLSQSCVNVFFPTERETHLGFLVQGPYMTNSARDDIPKDNKGFNISLVEETGELVVEALRWLRDRDWLTVNILNTMPLEYDKFRDYKSYRYVETIFTPIYDRFLAAIKEEPLIPAYDGHYVSGQEAVLGGSEALRKLLDDEQLPRILDSKEASRWVSAEITTAQRTQELWTYLRDKVEIEELDPEKLARRIDEDFLSRQSDDWIRDFYEYASTFDSRSYFSSSPFNILKQKSIIRLVDGKHVKPLHGDDPQAYLPSEHESRFPTVKREVCDSDKSLGFLKNLGLKKPDITDEVIDFLLPKYTASVEIDDAEHWEDIKLIVKALGDDSQQRQTKLIDLLTKTPFLWAKNAVGDSAFRKPGDNLYIRNSQLEMYFEGNPDAWFISECYDPYVSVRHLEQLDISKDVRQWLQQASYFGHVTICRPHYGSLSNPHKRGLNGFDPDFKIDGLEFALRRPTIERSKFIWNELLLPNKNCISGEVESSTRQYFDGFTEINEQVSIVGKLVREKAWLPDCNGNFVKPSELSLEDLPDDLYKDDKLANALGMRTANKSIQDLLERDDTPSSERRKLELIDGRSPEAIAEALRLYDEKKEKERETVQTLEPDEYSSELGSGFNRSGSPPIPRPPDYDHFEDTFEDKRVKAELEIGNEPDPEDRYELRIKRSWKPKNPETRKFLKEKYPGGCQIHGCGHSFLKRDGSPYFEAVHIIPRTSAQWLDHPRNAVCLCAHHAAQWKHGERSTPDLDILDQIRSSEEGQGHDISVELCGKSLLVTFTANHIDEFRIALEVTEYV
ncbi:MAG: hypothetical protein OXT68_06060 [Chloroflexota bacterium]|nr:hypothetical protein [Chloroflexota bacterium]